MGFGTFRGMGQLLGYARVSTAGQDVAMQTDALSGAGCARVWVEHVTGAGVPRPELAAVLEYARPGDTLVVWRLDRLGRSLRELVDLVEQLRRREVALRSLRDGITTETKSAAGRLQLHLFAALAEHERDLIQERTAAGLASAAQRGRRGGRPAVMTPAKLNAARRMRDAGDSLAAIAAALDVAKTTVRRHLEHQDERTSPAA